MDMAMVYAGILGLGPALFLVYFVLRKYTYPAVKKPFFSDPTLFTLFFIGLIVGTLIFLGYTYFMYRSISLLFLIIIAFGFTFVFELVKLVILNLKRFHGKSDTIFYGYGLGLGIGATFAFGIIYYIMVQWNLNVLNIIFLVSLAISMMLVLASTGIVVGEGVARFRVWEFLIQAIIMNVPFQLLFALYFTGIIGEAFSWIIVVLAVAYACVSFYMAVFKRLPRIVKDVLRMNGDDRKDLLS